MNFLCETNEINVHFFPISFFSTDTVEIQGQYNKQKIKKLTALGIVKLTTLVDKIKLETSAFVD